MYKEYALIVAGGSGSRIKSNVPKQFIKIGRFPVLMHTITAFFTYSEEIRIILILPESQIDYWKELCKNYNFSIPHKIVEGGIRRQDSVKNGLASINDDDGLVAIHDGVRPFVKVEIIRSAFTMARKSGNAVVTVALKDSIRLVTSEFNKSVNRTDFRIVQTPQVFSIKQIKEAYAVCKGEFTDDASIAEFAGYQINLVEGSYDNIKITTSEDLDYAETIITQSETGK